MLIDSYRLRWVLSQIFTSEGQGFFTGHKKASDFRHWPFALITQSFAA
ncbi:hypothetical protein RABR111495_22380 [Rahnella bruchi]